MLFACWPLDDGVDVEVGAKEAMVGDDSKSSSIQLSCYATLQPRTSTALLYSLINTPTKL